MDAASSTPPKQGTGLSSSFEPLCKGSVGTKKMKRIFLIGMLCGVMITAAVTYVFAIPANSNYWRTEIWKRGGAAWTSDKYGRIGWRWMVEPVPDTPSPAKRVIVPPSQIKVRSEQL